MVVGERPGELKNHTRVLGCALHMFTKTRLTDIEAKQYHYLQNCTSSTTCHHKTLQVFTYLQKLELGGSTKKTLWDLCQLVVAESPGEL